MSGLPEQIAATIREAVEGNVTAFYPCECDEHESGYDHFVDQLADGLSSSLGLAEETAVQIHDGDHVISNNPLELEMAQAVVRRNHTGNARLARRWVSGWSVVGDEQ